MSELKSRLSAYLAKVRRGETVLVFDRSTPIARLVPVDADELELTTPTLSLREIGRRKSRVKLRKPLDLSALLRADRDAR